MSEQETPASQPEPAPTREWPDYTEAMKKAGEELKEMNE